MDLDLPVKPSARTALERLIDYAGLFPPAQLAMAPALAEFAGIRSGPHAWMVGRFVVPASRVPELRRALGSRPAPALSVVLDVSREKKSDSKMTVPKSEMEAAATTSCPNWV